ncbi:PA domain-containing protein [Salinimicrobium sediminis]|uniref:Carboxypeptidase Q n=1 Tax=Salinimicrobium sediminis TaxID=1343891 RepID=A0A285WZR7_9FLAO|nr:M20/M25/M40 family metallo-hydrolase [Salinimicrobium sediminis]SOC78620.1 PA domain-containing protein [Salinimicrobium sediminis]
MKKIAALLLIMLSLSIQAQNNFQEDSLALRKIYDLALLQGQSYAWLDHLSNKIGGRLSGSVSAQQAVDYTKAELEALGLDRVWLQPVMVPKWTRGNAEYAYVQTQGGPTNTVNILALGGSVATPETGLRANVIEVQGIEDIARYGKEQIQGKIVFFNRPMPADLIHTFSAYGACVDQRYSGAAEAAKFGASGVIVRSLSHKIDEHPHTGSMSYGDLPNEKRIPAAAISTKDAEYLSSMLKLNKDLDFYFKTSSRNYEDVESYNVIGEIKGSERPDEYIVVGGHLDSWDVGDGAHDDGAGVVQSMEVLRLMKEAGIKPKRTLRVVLFMNEENGLRGGNKYAEEAKKNNESHIFALESDAGGFTPRGFSIDARQSQFEKIQSWEPLFKPYLIHYFEKGGSGADISPLKNGDIVLAGLRPDSQRYFDYHHAATDTFEAVNKRELELGAATMASLIYLVDKYGFDNIQTEEPTLSN